MPDAGLQGIQIPGPVVDLLRKHDLLRSLVNRQFVANSVRTVVITSEQREELLKAYRQHQGLQKDEVFQEHLLKRGLTHTDLIGRLELPVRIRLRSMEMFSVKAEQRFLARKDGLDRVVYSLLRLKDSFLARELYLQLSEGESEFAQLASKFSEGPEKDTLGVVGPIPLCQSHPDLVEKIRAIRPGTLLEPFQVQGWWLVVRLDAHLPATFDESTKVLMCGELFSEWVDAEVTRIISSSTMNDSAATPV